MPSSLKSSSDITKDTLVFSRTSEDTYDDYADYRHNQYILKELAKSQAISRDPMHQMSWSEFRERLDKRLADWKAENE